MRTQGDAANREQEDWQDVQTVGILTGDDKKELNRNRHLFLMFTLSNLGITGRGAATDSGPPGQHIHSGPPAFRGWGGGGVGVWLGIRGISPLRRNRYCVPEPVFFSPSPKSDYTVSAIKIVQFCM